MSTQVTIGTTIIDFPDQGDTPAWGEAITQFASACATQFQATQSTFDVPPTVSALPTATITNQLLTTFDSTLVRSFDLYYAIYRVSTGGGATSLAEEGEVSGIYNTLSATWNITHEFNGSRNTDGTLYNTFSMSGGDIRVSCAALSGGTYDGTNSKISYFIKTNNVSEA